MMIQEVTQSDRSNANVKKKRRNIERRNPFGSERRQGTTTDPMGRDGKTNE